jgi:hypothetical protein
MNEIIVKSQKDWDALPKSFEEFTVIKIVDSEETISINRNPGSSSVVAHGSSRVDAHGSSSVDAYDSSSVVAYDSSSVDAYGSSSVDAHGSSRVVAHGSSRVVAHDSSRVDAHGSSSVDAHDSSRVDAHGSSSVVAYGSSRVDAYDSSRVDAHGSSRVDAYDSSRVDAYDSSRVNLKTFSVAFINSKTCKIIKGKYATVIIPKRPQNIKQWIDFEGIKKQDKNILLYKRVSKDWLTQEGTPNETCWKPGTKFKHSAWEPKTEECGAGKYHACSFPAACNEFRKTDGDRYVCLSVKPADCYFWKDGSYPHKIAVRSGTVLYECDFMGEKI